MGHHCLRLCPGSALDSHDVIHAYSYLTASLLQHIDRDQGLSAVE